MNCEPELVIYFRDPVTHAAGFAVIDTLSTGVAYAATRLQRGLKWSDLAPLARVATIRFQLARVPLGGARVGLDYDPNAADADEVLGRFLTALSPYLQTSLSLGPDAGLTVERLESVLAKFNLPWRMTAVQQRQRWATSRWQTYLSILDGIVDGERLRDRQIPFSIAHAALTVGRSIKEKPTACVVGSGGYATQIALELIRLGVAVVAFGGNSVGLHAPTGIPAEILEASQQGLAPSLKGRIRFITKAELYGVTADMLILADPSDAVTIDNVGLIRASILIEAAANSITRSAEKVLNARNTLILPAFASTIGGVLLTNGALYGEVTSSQEGLEFIGTQVQSIVEQLVRLSATLNLPLRESGVRLAFHRWTVPPPGGVMAPDAPIERVVEHAPFEVVE